MGQRIASGAITGLGVEGSGPDRTVRLSYRRPGLAHMALTALGLQARGELEIDRTRIRLTEISRARQFVFTVPSRLVRSISTDFSRPLLPLFSGLLLLLIGGGGVALGAAGDTSADWWPDVEKEAVLIAGWTVVGLGVLLLLLFAFRRNLVIRFDPGQRVIHLRRSTSAALPFHRTAQTLEHLAATILEAGGQLAGSTPPPAVDPAGDGPSRREDTGTDGGL